MKLIKGMNLLDLDIQYFATSSAMSMANKYLKYSITITENWQDKINAISNVTVVVKAWRTNTGYTSYDDGGTCYCKIDGTTYSQGITTSQKVSYNSNTVFFEKTLNISHNTDGSKTLTCSAWFSGSDVFSSSEQSYSQTLTYIPRKSSVSCNSFYIGDSTTITIGSASSSFTHTLTYTYGDLSDTIATKTNLTSVGWTPDKELFYSRIPNGRTGYGSITCETFNGSQSLGTTTTNFNAYAKESECTPDVSATIVDTNADTIALTGDSSKLIKYLSKPKVTISADAKYSSSIKSRRIAWGDGQVSTNAEATFNGVTIPSLSVSATDSREYSKVTPYDLSSKWVEYVLLAFSNISLTREESTLSTAKVKVSGNYFNGSFGKVTNDFTLKYRYKPNEAGSTFTDYVTLTSNDIPRTNDTFDYSVTLQNIDYQKEYVFEFVLEDKAMVVLSGEHLLEKGEAIFRIGEDYIKTNGRILDRNGFDISLDMIYPVGAIYISSILVDPEVLFGGKWAKLEGRFLLGVSANYPEGTTGGEATHTLTVEEMPSHTHQQVVASLNSESSNTYNMDYATWGYGKTASQGAYTNATGGNQAHNNMPPYLAVHMWKRYE